ncbi:phosphate acetyltransferase [Buchnera aphidicola (Pemphigus obesinymphae)]|uniref:phosphate acetyltransferase n=1 Tax=Buchnera aphidicola TaxID=9 RepID=UPI002236FEF3|nr:phosphate acetyltransferase [Buchnera aphidicola]MCW5196631.1 phosphate acetyltransferase [Buchnera aphidicola (Pemphigus obesinymphae)]
MLRNIMLIPVGSHVELTAITIGLIKSITDQNLNVCFFKPVVECHNNKIKHNTTSLFLENDSIFCVKPIKLVYTESFFSINYTNILLDKIFTQFNKYKKEYDIMVIEGFLSTEIGIMSNILNYKIAKILNSEIIFIIKEDNKIDSSLIECTYFLKKVFEEENGLKKSGIIIDKTNKEIVDNTKCFFNKDKNDIAIKKISTCDNFYKNEYLFFKKNKLQLLAVIPFSKKLIKIPIIYFFKYLDVHIMSMGEINCYFIEKIILFDQYCSILQNDKILNSVLIIPFDQLQWVARTFLDKIKNSKVVLILLTGMKECKYKNTVFFKNYKKIRVPILSVSTNTLKILSKLYSFNLKVNFKDSIRLEMIKNHVSDYINRDWLLSLKKSIVLNKNISPTLFLNRLIKLSSRVKKRIILPEGYDSRIIKSAFICQEKGIADCILLGNPKRIHDIALKEGILLNKYNNIIDPEQIRNNYLTRLVNLRSHKGMTFIHAKEMIKDNIVLATLMLDNNDVDGIVAGAINSTANTVRPALQFIKMKSGFSLVSSLFFMLLPNKILIYADCAINIEPNSDELADIAIQSADTAKLLGIDPKIAMISYATYTSGSGKTVDKVRKATYIVKQKRPDLIVDGPLQYDAATVPQISILKSPKSCIAGCANILIFPDLNTGNTVYKAVQRLAKVIAVGPILQGFKKPVNDLSRGATIEDIVYTIAMTSIQSISL